MTAKEIAKKAIAAFDKKITGEVFRTIQNDSELMHCYSRAVQESSLDNVNRTIGKAIKIKYGLKNIDEREWKPISTLIQSHQKFE